MTTEADVTRMDQRKTAPRAATTRARGTRIAWLLPALMGVSAATCADDPLHGPCDGFTDDDHDRHFAPESCTSASTQCLCDDCVDNDATVYAGATELCDGKDNNCDALTDEGFRVGRLCGVAGGACGRNVCGADGAAVCSPTNDLPSPEVCDDQDNDCDGEIDEDFALGQLCTAATGACSVSGTTICSADGQSTRCSVDPPVPAPERCDDEDNNCDGAVDEDFGLGVPCTVGVGECQATGTVACSADGSGSECTATPGAPAAEICDGKDNDCDGIVDRGTRGCACPTTATEICNAGVWSGCPATPIEECNDSDDDCDGQIDEGFDHTGDGQACDIPCYYWPSVLETGQMYCGVCSIGNQNCCSCIPWMSTCGYGTNGCASYPANPAAVCPNCGPGQTCDQYLNSLGNTRDPVFDMPYTMMGPLCWY
ncbi:MAG: putative metal-binding motif-containing protein [Deltaproteobacteria bacterium]|nr:putative metal-binding motif-containing protein [Deltaproteobacteria bacterium]